MSDYQRKAIDCFPGYEIDTEGVVWSCWKNIHPKGLKGGTYSELSNQWKKRNTFFSKNGYIRIELTKDKKHLKKSIHRLLALNFIPNPENKPLVCHKNGNRKDNRLENLYWGTNSDNMKDAINHGTSHSLHQLGEKNAYSKLTTQQVTEIRRLKKEGIFYKDIAKTFNIHPYYVHTLCRYETWKHLTI
jgi:hypothetical protein